MTGEHYKRYFEVLELPETASFSEVRNSYLHLRSLYSKESIVTSPIRDEFSEESMQDVMRQIEDAYCQLLAFFDNKRDTTKADERSTALVSLDRIHSEVAMIMSFSGPVLREVREKMNVGLHEIALATNIRIRYLEDIEFERYESLPPEVYLRGFVTDYARFLHLDHKKIVDDYMSRYRSWKTSSER